VGEVEANDVYFVKSQWQWLEEQFERMMRCYREMKAK